MNQSTAQKVSAALLEWRDAETVSLLNFPMKPVTNKERGGKGQKDPEVKQFQTIISEIAEECITQKCEAKSVGLRIAFYPWKRNQDLSNCIKSIEDGLKNVAFGDDHLVDYFETVRVKAESKDDEGFTVEVLQITPKREAWI